MTRYLSPLDVASSLMVGLVAATALLDAAPPAPLDTECETISIFEHRPCNILINRPGQPHISSISPQ